MINSRVSADGALFVLDETAPPGTTCVGGQALTPLGVAYVANNILAAPPYYFPNGFKTDANGTLIIGPGPIIGYKGGYPYNANDELVAQLNQPVSPGDAWVAGIRVGPLGGVYIIDTTPPPEGGYSTGFSNGFEVYDGSPIHIFSPADLFASGEEGAWYDPSDLTTMFQDRAGTTPVTADGQTVGKILDKSGRGNHATAPSDASRPLYKTDGTYHWLQVDGVDDHLDSSTIDKTAWAGGMLVTGHIANSGTGGVLDGADGDVASGNHEPFSNERWYCAFGSTTRSDSMSAMSYGVKYVLGRVRNSTNSIYRTNGTQQLSVANTLSFGGSSIIRIASSRIDSESSILNGNIYSVVLVARAPTAQEITDTETWVNGKTGAY